MCFMWDETVAMRGSQEIGSCLYKYVRELLGDVKEIIFYSDCCPGQTRNIIISTVFLILVKERHEENKPLVIHHKFLTPGHTHMEADGVHALIERAKKKTTSCIEIPRDWSNFIRCIECTPKINVYQMEQSEFLNFKSLLKNEFVHRTHNTDGEKVYWNEINWLKYEYSQDNPSQILYKTSLKESEEFKVLDISRKKSLRNSQTFDIGPCNTSPIVLSKEKVDDLKSLLPYISSSSKLYYNAFINSLQSSSDTNDICPFEDPDEDTVEDN